MDVLVLPAPAKLNLFLHVTGRRADGYHTLQTLFQFLDHGDVVTLARRGDGRIVRRGGPPGVAPDDDLAVRAARLLQARTGTAAGADITVDKRLPAGGGLGGGSSDAATVLAGLNRLWGTGLDEDALAALGLDLGADVPVFVRGRAAWAEGVGEVLAPVAELDEPWYVVLVPPVAVSTAEVFAHPQLPRQCPPIKIRDFLAGRATNVLESIVRSRYPEVDAALRELGRLGPARMTGSGACVFAPFADEEAARAAWAALAPEWDGFVARGRNRSPLHEALDRGRAEDFSWDVAKR